MAGWFYCKFTNPARMGSALVCVELGVGPMFEPNKFGGVGKKKKKPILRQACGTLLK